MLDKEPLNFIFLFLVFIIFVIKSIKFLEIKKAEAHMLFAYMPPNSDVYYYEILAIHHCFAFAN